MTHHRPDDSDDAHELEPEDVDEDGAPARDSRATGGDAPAAGSIAEREALARGADAVDDPDERRSPKEGDGGSNGPAGNTDGTTQSDAGMAGGGEPSAGPQEPEDAPEA